MKNKEEILLLEDKWDNIKNRKSRIIEDISNSIIKLIEWDKDNIELDPNIKNTLEQEIFEKFSEKIVWQKDAKIALVNAIINNLFSIRPKKWPLWVFFFTWPSWVGKTQIARTLADTLLWSEDYLTKIDCENYTEEHTANNLFWSPKSYVWYWEPTPLNDIKLFKSYQTAKANWTVHNQIRYLNNFSIILFDEIEKAHPKIHQSLLSMMSDWKIKFPSWKEDDKRLNFSNTTDISNSIIIFTSNIWNSNFLSNGMWFINQKSNENNKEDFKESFKKTFSPEFIWRIDDFITFDMLTKEDIYKIIKIEIEDLQWHFWILDWNIKLNVSDDVINSIIEKSHSLEYGARPAIKMFKDTVEADINNIINSWQLVSAFDNDNYIFTIEVKFKKWEYKYLLTKSYWNKKEYINKILSKIEEDIKFAFISNNYIDIESKIKKLKENGDVSESFIINNINNIYYNLINEYDLIHEIDSYEQIILSSQEEKKLFKNIWRRVVKKIIERKLDLYNWDMDYDSKEFKKLFISILKYIKDINWKVLNPSQVKEIIKIIDYYKKSTFA